jgi:hypothetical protein
MTIRTSTKLRNLMASTTGFSSVFANGIIDVYTGAQPITADLAPTGTRVGRITLNSGAFTAGVATNGLTFSAAVAGAVAKSGVWSFNGLAPGGTAGWFRLKANAIDNDSDDTTNKLLPRLDGSVAVSGADLNMTVTTIADGTPVTVDTFTVTVPA